VEEPSVQEEIRDHLPEEEMMDDVVRHEAEERLEPDLRQESGEEQRHQAGEPSGDLLPPSPQPPRSVPVAADHGDPQAVREGL